ncbi:MAG: acyl-CoA dehydrogenase family protein [Alphaproteobacteria bacterium]|nr:acyl-CoA dehydrogenase family protein [Alphaproteobacteria bacterium]
MDFSYSTEQTLLKDSVERFLRDAYAFETRRKLVASDEGFSRDNWALFAELGWLGMALPEEFGGSDGSAVETMIIMEVIGRGLMLEPYLASVVLGAGLVSREASPAQRREILPALIQGELLLAFAYAEPQSRFALNDVEVSAARDGEGYLIRGRKSVVFHAAAADKVVVSARTGGGARDADGISLFIVENGCAGLARRDYRTVDGLRASDLEFDAVQVGAEALIGTPDAALPLIERAIDHGIAAVCAEAVGAMAVLLEATNEFLKTRRQFGRPIGDFQVLQHRAVDMFMAAEQARSMALMATLKLDEEEAARKKALSAAKVQIGKAGRFVGQQAVQLHGGMGMTDELSVGHYFKRLTMIDTLFGNVDHHLERFASL